MKTRTALTALMLISTTALASYTPGSVIEDAALVDITAAGFDALTDALPALLPSSIPIDDISDDGGIYEYALSNMWVEMEMTSASITPQDGYLDVDIDMSIQINSSSDLFEVYYEILWVIGESCYGYVAPFDASIQAEVGLTLQDLDGDGYADLDATVSNLVFDYDLDGASDVNIQDCSISYVEEALNYFGISIWDLALSLADPLLSSAVEGFLPDLEATIEDAFSQAVINQEMDLGGVTAQVELYPADITIEPAGMRLNMNGGMSVDEAADCVAIYDPGGSLQTLSDAPLLASAPGGVSPDYHMGLMLSDDFGNQALYALWRGGLLCYRITEEEIGFPIDTSILGLMAGDAFDDLFPVSKPLVIQTRPRNAPVLDFVGEHDVAVTVDELGLEFYGELDHRQSMILGLDLAADVGIDLALDDATGELAVGVDLSSDAVGATVGVNEFKPDADADIEANFASVFDTLIGGVVGGLLEDLTFALPSMEGFGLTGLEISAAGDDSDWLGTYASVGIVPYASTGCTDSSGGCASSDGCGGGCASGGPSGGKWSAFVFAFALAIMRRREDERS